MTLNLTEKEYRALPIESYSSLKNLLSKNPIEDFRFYKKDPFAGNDRTRLGTAIHHYLQGNRHLVSFHNKSKSEKYQEFEKEFLSLTSGEGLILPPRFEEDINKIMINVNTNQQILKMLDECKIENPYLFKLGKLDIKSRLDLECDSYIADIKTTSMGISVDEFKDTSNQLHYDLQAALYQQAVLANKGILKPFYFIAILTKPPYTCKIFKASDKFMQGGIKKIEIIKELYERYILGKEVWIKNDIEEI